LLNEDRATTRLYLITPPALDPHEFAPLLEAALEGGDVAAVQLRLKDVDDEAIRAAAARLQPIVQERGIAFIMNDRPDLAAELDCDGVHVGEEDWPYPRAREAVGPDRIVGVTCGSSRHRALVASEAGADYVAFGAFFATQTKQPKTSALPDILRWWSEMMVVPCVAIGGITVSNARELVEAGADFLAVSAGVWEHPDGAEIAVRAFNALF